MSVDVTGQLRLVARWRDCCCAARAGPSFLRGAEKLKGRNPESATTGSTWPSTVGRAHLRLFHLLSLAPHHGLRRLGQWNLSRTRPAVPAIGCQRANKMFQNVIGNSDPRAVPALAGGGGGGSPRYADTFPFFQHLDLEGKSSPQKNPFGLQQQQQQHRRRDAGRCVWIDLTIPRLSPCHAVLQRLQVCTYSSVYLPHRLAPGATTR